MDTLAIAPTTAAPTVDMLEDVKTATPAKPKAAPAAMDAATLAKLITKEASKIGKSNKQNRETIQNWLVCASVFKGKDVADIIGQIMDIAEPWDGMNIKRLEKCIRDGIKGAKLSRKEDGWKLVCKPQSVKKISFTVPGEWFTYAPEPVSKDVTLEEALAQFVAKREKKGDTMGNIALALEGMMKAE